MRLRGAEVIVIDDHADLVENVTEILEDEGARVSSATSAASGLALAQRNYEVALVDVRLPDARGVALVPRLKSGDGLQEVLLVTGHASIQDAMEAVKAGASAYVLKPFDADELVSTVQRSLEQVRLRRRAASLQAAQQAMVDTVQALLLVLDERGRVVQANAAVATATGAEVETILGGDFVEAHLPPRDRAAFRRACDDVQQGEVGVRIESALVHRDADGRIREHGIIWRLSGLREEEGHRIYVSGLDMTDVRKLERRTRLAEKLAAVGSLSAGLAHEIRNPLNAAGLQLQLLERKLAKLKTGAEARDALDMVRAEIDRLDRLVSDFLAFARPQAIAPRDIDVVEFARSVVDLERPVANERGIELRLEVPATKVVVAADVQRLKQVMLNLVRNALDACHRGNRVDVEVASDGAGARVAVRDDGPGIPEEILPRIFEPFFTTKETGTGLGMAIAHSLVELHGGHIDARSDHGARFVITLPRHPPKPL